MSELKPDSIEFAEKLKKAIDQHQAGDLYNAEYGYKELLRAQPDHPQINYFLACLFMNIPCFEGAILHLQHALSFEDKPSYRAALASAFFRAEQYESAIEESKHILSLDQNNYDALYITGNSLLYLDRYDEAEGMLRKLFDMNNQDPQVHADLGELFRRQGKLDWAAAAFQSALKLQPQHIVSMIGLGRVHIGNNAFDHAERVLRKAMEIEENNPRVHQYLGEVFYRRAQYDWAAGAAKTSWEKDPSNFDNMMLWGRSLYKINHFKDAEFAFRCAYYREPENDEARFLYARVCILASNPHWAVGLLKSLVNHPKYAAEVSDLLVFAQLQAGGRENAMESMRKNVLAAKG